MKRIALLSLISVLAAGPAAAQSAWEKHKGDCDKLLARPSADKVRELAKCVELWETYRDITGLTPEQKETAAKGMSVVYHLDEGDARDLAYDALRKMGMKPIKRGRLGLKKGARKSEAPTTKAKYVPEVSPKRQKEADKFLKKGLKLHKKRKWRDALGWYEKGMRADPNNLGIHYNAACAYALLGESKSAVELLEEIKSRQNRRSRRLLGDARKDRDFRKIRGLPSFKKVTGYAEIVLLNGAGAEGKPHIKRLGGELARADRKPAFVGTDEAPRGRPLVWYKPGFEDVAEELKELVDPQNTKLKTIDFNTAIDRYDFDVYVVWGMPHRTALLDMPDIPKAQRQGGGDDEPFDPLKAVKDAKGTVDEAGGLMKKPEVPELP